MRDALVMQYDAQRDANERSEPMKIITLRKLPPVLARRIEREAERTGTSAAATVVRMLCEAVEGRGSKGPTGKKRDLSWLAGIWSKEEADEFDRVLGEQRKIEPKLWR